MCVEKDVSSLVCDWMCPLEVGTCQQERVLWQSAFLENGLGC